MIEWQVSFRKKFNTHDSLFLSLNNSNNIDSASKFGQFLFYLNKGDFHLYKNKDNTLSRKYYLQALNLSQENKNYRFSCEAIKRLLNVNRHSFLLENTSTKPYLELYKKIAYDKLENIYLDFYNLTFSFQYFKYHNWNQNLEKKLLSYANTSNHFFLNGQIYALVASYYAQKGDLEKAILLEEKAIQTYEKITYKYSSTKWKNSHIAIARYHYLNNDFTKVNNYLSKIKSKPLNKIEYSNDRFRFFYQSLLDSINKDYKSAYKNLGEYVGQTEIVLLENNQIAFNEIETKFQTAKKEKQNLLLQSEIEKKQRQQRNLWIGGSITLIFLSITGFLIYKNTKRKQLLAEQEKALESQKLRTVLKEQELNSIDAMIAGQEKERQRIANDLHDDLGSLMANVKLHFDALKDNPSPDLYIKANTLIETAYNKIRGMAHAKNSGVMANKGLLKAIHEIANSNSIANKLNIQVVDYGLEQQLENSLELTIFRIIQELIANIIKHADATEATIHITNHEDTINLMVEDNGKGFNTKTISKHQGMGIHSIDKRIENLGGTVTIESEINKGTTVIIDIPTL